MWIAKRNIQIKLTSGEYVTVKGGDPLPENAVTSNNIHYWCDFVPGFRVPGMEEKEVTASGESLSGEKKGKRRNGIEGKVPAKSIKGYGNNDLSRQYVDRPKSGGKKVSLDIPDVAPISGAIRAEAPVSPIAGFENIEDAMV